MKDPTPRADAIFASAIDIANPDGRRAYLDQACAGDAALRQEVESLLAANSAAGDFLQYPAPVGAVAAQRTMVIPPLSETTGTRIGRYKLLEQIGEGGFGVVWLAEQQEPVRRRVALKIIKLGMDTREVVARFEAERQALAMMDHPHIASVFDGGATDTGRPYFVMELVKGVPITDYCDANQLSTRERLELFMQVCQAVQHAHQKGVIHRDLKPSNILVTVKDDRPVPKVIDFGIAKATQMRLTEKTIFTRFQQWIGTPAYMSPEQAGLGSLDVDTRSDIYSLGVLLYELLTGRTPFDTQKLLEKGYDAVMRTIREEEPPKPSTRLSTLSQEELSAIATKRHAVPAKLNRLVHGDLDWIVMKALEKDRTRRYETPSGLAADLQRHLNDEAVMAGPPTVRYRLKKFIRKHRAPVAVVAGFVGFLALSSVTSTGLALWATRERSNAQRSERITKEALTQMRIREAEQFFSANDSSTALASLARELRDNPSNRAAAERLVSALTERNFPLPVCRPLQRVYGVADRMQAPPGTPIAVRATEFSPDGRFVVTASDDKTAQLWDALTLQPKSKPIQHSSLVLSARFSPDAQQVLTVVENGEAFLWEGWDNLSGQPSRKALKHGAKINHAEFSLDGRWVLTASDDKTARLWDAHTGQQSGQSLIHSMAVRRAAFSPDGQFVLTISYWVGGSSQWASLPKEDQRRLLVERVTLWDVHTSQPLNHPSAWQNANTIEFSPDGQRVLVAGASVGALICDTQTGQVINGFSGPQHDGHVLLAKFSPDGQRFVTGSDDKTSRLWDARTGQPLTGPLEHGDEVTRAEFSPDGQRLVTVAKDGLIRIWDTTTGAPLGEAIRTDPYGDGRAQFSPDGQHLLVTSWASIVQVWDIRVGNALIERILGADKFSPTEPDVMLMNAWNSQCQTWDVRGMQPLSVPFGYDKRVPIVNGNPAYYRTAQFTLDGSLVATIEGNTVGMWDARTGKQVHGPVRLEGVTEPVQFPQGMQRSRFLMSPDGLAIYAADQKALNVWDTRTGRILLRSPLPRRDRFELDEISPDGSLLSMQYGHSSVRVWDAHTGKLAVEPYGYDGGSLLFRTWPSPNGEPAPFECGEEQLSSRFSADGKRLVTAHADGSAWIWDTRTGRVLTKLLKHGGRVVSARFSADGRYVLTASDDKTARVWDSYTGEPLMAPLKHQSAVEVAEFSRDGQRIATAAKDNTTRLWDAQTGLALTEPRHHRALDNGVEFSSDGSWVYIHAQDGGGWGTAPVPSIAPAWLPDLAEAIAGHRLTPHRTSETVPEGRLLQLREELAMQPGNDYYSRWARWFFADRTTRTISPQSATALPHYIQRRMSATQFETLREVVRLSPSDGLAVARLAKSVQNGYEYSRPEAARLGEADFLSRRAAELSPNNPEVQRIRAEILRQIENTPKL